MDSLEGDDYNLYWETQRFFGDEELEYCSWGFDTSTSGDYDSSSPDEHSTVAKGAIDRERNRRNHYNEKLYTLRSLVPRVTKMDKLSIVKDAIKYIQELQEQEKNLLAEVLELEPVNGKKRSYAGASVPTGKKKMRTSRCSESPRESPLNVIELKVRKMGDRASVVSVTCDKRKHTVARLCEALEPLQLNIVSANVTSFSGNIIHNLFVETHEAEGEPLKKKIEMALAGL